MSVIRDFSSRGRVILASIWLIWLVSLCGDLVVLQASSFECFTLYLAMILVHKHLLLPNSGRLKKMSRE